MILIKKKYLLTIVLSVGTFAVGSTLLVGCTTDKITTSQLDDSYSNPMFL